MQTFMPYPDIEESAVALDPRRRFNQINEANVLVACLEQGPYILKHFSMSKTYRRGPVKPVPPGWVVARTPWYAHAACRMWWGYPEALKAYTNAVILAVWRAGTHPNMTAQLYDLSGWVCRKWPSWLGDDRLHRSHRSNLLRKDPEYYGQHGWTERPDLPYHWPRAEHYLTAADMFA